MGNYFLWLAKFVTVVLIVLFIVPVVLVAALGAIVSKGDVKAISSDKVVAVVSIDGVIEDSKDALTALYKHAQDDDVSGIVLRINSPGGAVGPSQDIYSAVQKLKAVKPIVASLGTVAASGGLYSALSASKIYCQPGTITGSIGVIMQVPNVKKIIDQVGFEMVTVKSGALKDVGNMFREMDPIEREFLQQTVSVVHEDFVRAVADGRGIEIEKVKEFSDGRVIIGSQAKELKLVDEFGDVYDAARSVFEIKGTPLKANEYPKLIFPDDRLQNLRRFLESIVKVPQLLSPVFSFKFAMN